MAIFPKILLEKEVQTNDATRLDATACFVSKDEAAITLVEIEPDATTGFIDVTGTGQSKDWFLDWEYTGVASSVETVKVRVTTDGAPLTVSDTIDVLIPDDDKLFSDDKDILLKEEEILKWLPDGKTSFLYKHRQAQKEIIEDFNERGVVDTNNEKLTKDAFLDLEEVRQWSLNKVLSMIFQDNSNVVGDVFALKAANYNSMALKHKFRAFFRLDIDGDGTIDNSERSRFRTTDLVRF